jgi:hypothetical protein
MKPLLQLILAAAMIATACGEPRERNHNQRESHNYIIERQQAGLVQGPPTSRIIIGRREIDVYRNGMIFEKNNLVGIRGR